MPDFTSYSSGFGTIHLLAKTIHLVSVLVSVFNARSGENLPKILADKEFEPRVGIERFLLCFPSKFSHQTADSQGYSATTRLNPVLLVHYSATEELTEEAASVAAVLARRGDSDGSPGQP
jgi:hypothetical protein